MVERDLIRAAQFGAVEMAREALRKGADPNARTDDGEYSALQVAAQSGRPEVCRLLIEAGAEIDAQSSDQYRRTALQLGARNADVCKVLLEGGASVDLRGPSGKTALHFAAQHGNSHAIEVLLDAGADVNAVEKMGSGALHWVQWGFIGGWPESELPERIEACRVLIERGIDRERPHRAGATPLKESLTENGALLSISLVRLGCDPSFVPDDPAPGYLTPFQKAVDLGLMDFVRELVLEHGQDLAQTTLAGKSMYRLAPDSRTQQELRSLAIEVASLRSLATGAAIGQSVDEQAECVTAPARRSASMSPI